MGFYWMLRGSTEFYWVLLGFSGFCCFFTGFYWFILNCSWFYWAFLGFTGFYWVSVGFIGFYWVLLGLIVFFFPEAFGGCFCDVPTIKEHHPLPVDGTIDDVPVEERQHPSLLFVFFGIFFSPVSSSVFVCLSGQGKKKPIFTDGGDVKGRMGGWGVGPLPPHPLPPPPISLLVIDVRTLEIQSALPNLNELDSVCTVFYWVWFRFWMGCTEFYWVLRVFSEFY